MRKFRRLPRLLRVASIVGLLFSLASVALAIKNIVMGQLASPDSSRVVVIVADLMWLGLASYFVVNAYSTRFRRPEAGPFPLDSWQSQVRAIALLSVVPLCGIALTLLIPLTSDAFWVAFFVYFNPLLAIGVWRIWLTTV